MLNDDDRTAAKARRNYRRDADWIHAVVNEHCIVPCNLSDEAPQ
jgi:hypothetical protein